jgi:fatty acid desaturase
MFMIVPGIVPGIRSQFDPNADPILNPALDQDMADKMAQAEQIIATQEARDARVMRRYVAPLAAVAVGLAALYVQWSLRSPSLNPLAIAVQILTRTY